MPPKPLKPCNKTGCVELTRDTYCESHRSEKYKYYDQWIRDPQTKQFYQSVAWKRLRDQALRRDDYLCQVCLSGDRYTTAETVHHVIEVKRDWSKRLELNNLQSVCNACHNKIHK
ncbi:HNH endonuclease [Thermoactinomyces sp. DSM 45892]|uniref:HNH endonuclease n=1 Tax=Thermoactinomyces sp. DSM 45892 TaxID=1882753 RepID=UPI00089662D8|nr:HNH endonuclease [Thermoactinomyces sp. DSM 45892]SDY69138.1 5-methylcytosine-specific restriction enzyme A [Thermoactinomyces sp. DSM 45892]